MSFARKNEVEIEISVQLKSEFAEEIKYFASAADLSIHLSKLHEEQIELKAEFQGKTALFEVNLNERKMTEDGSIQKFKGKNQTANFAIIIIIIITRKRFSEKTNSCVYK